MEKKNVFTNEGSGKMKVSEYIVNYLVKIGINHIFGVSGGMVMWLVDAIHKHPDIEFVQMLHEQSAVIAADAYAQYTGNLGVVLVTSGPGATNAITGVAASYIDSTPLLVISGQCKTPDIKDAGMRSKGVGEVDIVSMVKEITKFSTCISNYSITSTILPFAIEASMAGRKGPVWLEIPIDVQAEVINE
jgi:acetolactate synthase-1/2/3 large subunit